MRNSGIICFKKALILQIYSHHTAESSDAASSCHQNHLQLLRLQVQAVCGKQFIIWKVMAVESLKAEGSYDGIKMDVFTDWDSVNKTDVNNYLC